MEAIPFVEEFKFPSGYSVTFDADSFEAWCENALPIMKGLTCCEPYQAKDHGIPVGDKLFYVRECEMPLEMYRSGSVKYAKFSRPVKIPILADKWRDVWMSLTPNEVLTLRGQVKRSKGDVAMAGLGLGWTAKKVLQRSVVDKLTVYEIDNHVIETFGESLQQEFGDRIQIVNVSAYDAPWIDHGMGLWDIWQDMSGARVDSRFKTIQRKMNAAGKVCLGWGVGANPS